MSLPRSVLSGDKAVSVLCSKVTYSAVQCMFCSVRCSEGIQGREVYRVCFLGLSLVSASHFLTARLAGAICHVEQYMEYSTIVKQVAR